MFFISEEIWAGRKGRVADRLTPIFFAKLKFIRGR